MSSASHKLHFNVIKLLFFPELNTVYSLIKINAYAPENDRGAQIISI